MKHLALRGLATPTTIPREQRIGGIRADSAVRVAVPLLSGVLTTVGLVLNYRKHPQAFYFLIAGGTLTALLAATEILAAEESRGPLR